ncbi:unnamed protein product, partial [Anisakis simplex]|uniref:Jumonji domain-containing protein 4 n=1 Tax=Anisakis simplex TaxID=6269 RepID=A0A0M3J186_ANISI
NASDDTAKYVKDWHFQRESGTSYALYDLPSFLRFDWINNEKWSDQSGKDPFGDYRFVYFGVKNSWTIFHSDVMSSYSWSANICGRKLWYFVPPGQEELFRKDRDGFFEDITCDETKFVQANVIQFIQLPGEIVFVPSNWYHQVHNLEDAISINHNFINASNVDIVLTLICNRLVDVRNEIDDVKDVFSKEEFNEQCQKILKADIRINFEMLKSLVDSVIEERLSNVSRCWICAKHRDNLFECKKDDECLQFIIDYVKNRCCCSDDENNNGDDICQNCRQFMNEYEISCALRCSYLIDLYSKC